MARLEDLITSVGEAPLRDALRGEVKRLKNQTRFGLVYERHLPETVFLAANGGLRVGDAVRRRREPSPEATLRVTSIRGTKVKVQDHEGKSSTANIADLLVVKRFGEPVYPTLTSLGSVVASKDQPFHSVINGENFHALQLLLHTCEGQVDCIYIDPPYNTGARDWKYNNHYIDSTDTWRHSKWLSFMEKRLRLARRLLKADSVLVVTIDEHEVHHLGLLLEQLFPEATRQLVTIVNNPKGVTQGRLSRVEEYAVFCVFGDAQLTGVGDDLLSPQTDEAEVGEQPRWKGLLRSGDEAARQDRPDMFYPVLIDEQRGAVVDAGDPLPLARKPNFRAPINGLTPVWPVRRDGSLGRWSVGPPTLRRLIDKGYVALGSYQESRKTWAITYLSKQLQEQVETGVLVEHAFDDVRNVIDVRYTDPRERRLKTVWHRSSHDAGAYGTDLLKDFLGKKLFNYPKSLYAVRDTLAAAVGTKRDALIVDFFAGSGTTLHATALLNSQDGGNRRTVLVTNNEVDERQIKNLRKEGLAVGDADWERHGIFEAVCRPRCEAVLTGKRPDGVPVQGKYFDGRPYADGLEGNIEFFRIDYLDPDEIEIGKSFNELHPLLWLKAGALAKRPRSFVKKPKFLVVQQAGYAVLFNEAAMPKLITELSSSDAISHVYLCTNSDDAYAEMCDLLGPGYVTERLFGDYLDDYRHGVRFIP